ncbi:MAG: polysaccharide deacetylase family protein [Lentisphaerae bacterium]|nr:polysaccharide deacetylase family protein [Lentisphaerota bacterium]
MIAIQFCWPDGKAGAFTASYDDGLKEDRRLVEVFNRHGIRGTWCLNSSRVAETVSPDGTVAWPELKTLYAGHEVAAHSVTHPFLDRIPEERILLELIEDRRRLEAGAGCPVKGMSLPNGGYDRRVLAAVARAGIVHCRTVVSTQSFALPVDFLEWHPTCHHRANLTELWQKFLDAKEPHKLFYLWGHSYEFGRQNNWELIEEFGAKVKAAIDAGTLWCATNMQVFEYVTAWRELWCSLDGHSFRNTRGTPVWFKAGKDLIRIGPGETRACPASCPPSRPP